MAQPEERNIQLKLLVDSKARKVLFAEADKNFIDFLFNLLVLPLSTVIKLLKNHSMVGCLPNLYESIESLSDTYLQPNQSKDSLLKPKVTMSGSSMLLPAASVEVDFPTESKGLFYFCNANKVFSSSFSKHGRYGKFHYYVAHDPKAICPDCNNSMSIEGTFVNPPSESSVAATRGEEEGGYVKGVVTYMVMDDLSVKPMSTVSSISLLNKFNIKEVGALEEKVISLDINEGVKLLQASLHSKTVLTDVFLGKKQQKTS